MEAVNLVALLRGASLRSFAEVLRCEVLRCEVLRFAQDDRVRMAGSVCCNKYGCPGPKRWRRILLQEEKEYCMKARKL